MSGKSVESIKKWDKASSCFDIGKKAEERRYGSYKRSLFSKARGKCLLVAVGTGADFKFLPEGLDIVAIDFSPEMLKKAEEKVPSYKGNLSLKEANVENLGFDDESFDTVITSCTFCSVPNPVDGLKELRRVLKDDGQILMFEHIRAGNFLLGTMMDIMNPIINLFGPNLNRTTGENLKKAGFKLTRDFNVYLDMVKLYEAKKS